MTSATRPLALEDQNIREYSDQELNELRMITSSTGAALLPEGVDAQRPGEGAIPAGAAVMRGSKQAAGDYLIEFWNRSAAAWHALASRQWVMQAINTAKSAIEDWVNGLIGFTIIYPNGTEAAPANLAINSRIVAVNPFPGHRVILDAQVLYGGNWVSVSPAYGSSAGHGFKAFQLGDDIVVVSASTLLSASVTLVPITGLSGNTTTPLPLRVNVWKSGVVI